jgi:glycine cleavage system H protein
MAFIEKFLGKRIEIPEDRRYYTKNGLWAKSDGWGIVFGLSEPALVLMGGLKDLDWLVKEGQPVKEGESVIFAITGKILYIDSPIAGIVYFNPEIKQSTSLTLEDSYGKGWLFRIEPEEEVEKILHQFADADTYIESLKGTEGFKNPEGLKGGVSGICKAVYTGIRDQEL